MHVFSWRERNPKPLLGYLLENEVAVERLVRDIGFRPLILKRRLRLLRQELVQIVHPPRPEAGAQIREGRLGNGIQRP